MLKKIIPLVLITMFTASYASVISTGEHLYHPEGVSAISIDNDRGFYLGGGVLFDRTNARSYQGENLHTDHVGFDLHAGYLKTIVGPQALGLVLQYSKLGNIAVANRGYKNFSFNNISLLGQYQYRLKSGYQLSALGGYGLMLGENTRRWMPVLGVAASYMISHHVSLFAGYQHYFGVANHHAFNQDSSVPDFDTINLGIHIFL